VPAGGEAYKAEDILETLCVVPRGGTYNADAARLAHLPSPLQRLYFVRPGLMPFSLFPKAGVKKFVEDEVLADVWIVNAKDLAKKRKMALYISKDLKKLHFSCVLHTESSYAHRYRLPPPPPPLFPIPLYFLQVPLV
jgi:hypothetical protein